MDRRLLRNIISSTLLAIPGDAFASDGERGGFYFLFGIINFAVFLGILYVWGWTKLKKFFADRSEGIERSVEEISGEKLTVLKTYDDLNYKLSGISKEVKELIEEARIQGDKIKLEVISGASLRSSQIIDEARQLAEREAEEVKTGIGRDILAMSLALAEKKLKERLGKAEHAGLIDGFIRELGGTA